MTSVGPSCKTPCSVAVQAPDSGFSVTYTLNKFQPTTIPVQVIRIPGDLTTPATTTFDPNPVVAQLQPAGPPPKAARKKVLKPKKPKAGHGRGARARGHRRSPIRRKPARRRPAADCLHCTKRVRRIVGGLHHA